MAEINKVLDENNMNEIKENINTAETSEITSEQVEAFQNKIENASPEKIGNNWKNAKDPKTWVGLATVVVGNIYAKRGILLWIFRQQHIIF